MARRSSDVFICKVGDKDYWAYPSPYIVRARTKTIRFRNLTKERVKMCFGTELAPRELSIEPESTCSLVVPGKATARLYLYDARVAVPPPPGVVPGDPEWISVQGGSPPKIIIDR